MFPPLFGMSGNSGSQIAADPLQSGQVCLRRVFTTISLPHWGRLTSGLLKVRTSLAAVPSDGTFLQVQGTSERFGMLSAKAISQLTSLEPMALEMVNQAIEITLSYEDRGFELVRYVLPRA